MDQPANAPRGATATPRRALLAGGALLLGLGGGARADAPMLELAGTLSARNAERFATLVGEQLDRSLSLRITARPVEGRDFSVSLAAPLLLVFVRGRGPAQVAINGDHTLRDGGFVVDGVYRVKNGGMHQGILAYGLEALPGQEVRRLRDGALRRITL